ncbi:enediyne biosynthesis protein UnbU [Haloechinothrix aidingensis]|uniref:enediyne biosynthesis protein UnbU n=1 Tax=Haloechinothrix aidingensis TaxID=2752311 RepID=UPI001C60E1FB|nr:enediyne biosynthesis protein UnbU [Haloechinothrix aidingensis]
MTTTTTPPNTDASGVSHGSGSGQDGQQRRKPAVDTRVKALRRFALSITAFTVVGHLVLGFEQSPITPIVALLVSYATALLFEWLDSWAREATPEYAGGRGALMVFLLPPHITALACAMLLYGNSSMWPYIFAVVVANTTKYAVRVRLRGKLRHVLNPSNAGIAITLVLFPWVGIAPPYHFTNDVTGAIDWLVPLGILMLGTMLNAKLTGKLPLILAWAGGFVAQAVLRWLILDHSLAAALLPVTGVAFILYTNYMITDPGTTPVKTRNQVVFGLVTAAIYGILVVYGVVFGLFFALVITCALRGVVLVAEARSGRLGAGFRERLTHHLTPATARATAPAAPGSRGGRL